MDGTQVAHERVRGFVASLCFVLGVLFWLWMLVCICLPPFFQMMTWPDPILEDPG